MVITLLNSLCLFILFRDTVQSTDPTFECGHFCSPERHELFIFVSYIWISVYVDSCLLLIICLVHICVLVCYLILVFRVAVKRRALYHVLKFSAIIAGMILIYCT
jgi:hypothetical protein